MRPEGRFALVAAAALASGALLAEPYARLAAPYYAAVDRLLAAQHAWTIEQVAVAPDPGGRGSVLRLVGEVRRQRGDAGPAALVTTRVQVGEAIETPLVFWTLLLAWPAASGRQRWLCLALGAAMFLVLEAATTGVQLMHSLAEAAAMLEHGSRAQADEPLTLWERWSRFLEAGGSFVLAVAAALATLALANSVAPRQRAD
jgi:hypothetical protein